MEFAPLPDSLRLRWRRLDVPGRETTGIVRLEHGWCVTGEVTVVEAGVDARLRYSIACDDAWHTRTATVEGDANGVPIRFSLEADGAGQWRRDGAAAPLLAGTVDIDLGFTPATNLLPIRRIGLSVGDAAAVRSAWLRFPDLRLDVLEQSYLREAEFVFRYRAMVDGEPFSALLETDGFGCVREYEGLWTRDD